MHTGLDHSIWKRKNEIYTQMQNSIHHGSHFRYMYPLEGSYQNRVSYYLLITRRNRDAVHVIDFYRNVHGLMEMDVRV